MGASDVARLEFVSGPAAEPHRERTRMLLASHPEALALCGNAPASALLVVGLVALQLATAWALRGSPLWIVLLIAYTGGAIADHALWVLIHECAHNLVFKTSRANALLSIAANLPIVFPGAIGFRKYHLLHHAYMGRPDLDADLPSPIEARLVGRSRLGKALWLSLFFAVQAFRATRLDRVRLVDGWYVLNVAAMLAFAATAVAVGGWTAFAYLMLSSAFSIGIHPVGARWIQEHYLVFPGAEAQETYSYYGRMNLVALNVGYHNEHHDLTRVPWHRLPRLKRLAPELYESLQSHRSWTRLLLRFVFDRSLSLRDRVVRPVAATDIATPIATPPATISAP